MLSVIRRVLMVVVVFALVSSVAGCGLVPGAPWEKGMWSIAMDDGDFGC
jgi:hypothetical protein